MKKIFLIAALAALCFTVKAQVKPLDTATCNVIINIQQKAVQIISSSNIPTKESDEIRGQLTNVAQFFTQKKQEIIADEKKKAILVPVVKKP